MSLEHSPYPIGSSALGQFPPNASCAPIPWMGPPAPDVTPLMWAYCHEHDVVEAHLKALELPAERMASRLEEGCTGR